MQRILEIPYRIMEILVSLLSRTIHTIVFGGNMDQTLSARAFYEANIRAEDDKWDTIYKWINRIFFWEDDHCLNAWVIEVSRAQQTLDKSGILNLE